MKIKFENIQIGANFKIEKDFFIKIPRKLEQTKSFNAIRLTDGKLFMVEGEVEVKAISVVINWSRQRGKSFISKKVQEGVTN